MSIEALLWVDLETTGSDETKDCIIEVGAILTSPDLEPLHTWEAYIEPTDRGLGRMFKNKTVREMHEANGLIETLLDVGADCRPDQFADDVVCDLEALGYRPKTVMLAGSGVGHFDRRFIKAQMPKLDRFLHYACVDVGVVRRLTAMWGYEHPAKGEQPNVRKTHRALDDIRLHLEEARQFKAAWSEGLRRFES